MFRYLSIFIFVFTALVTKAQCPSANFLYSLDLNCSTSLANLSVTCTNLTPPFSYTWTPNVSTTSVALNLTTNSYVIQIKDANNCTGTANQIVNLNSLLNINFTNNALTKTVSCFGGNDGVISATATGSEATPPIQYNWSNGSTLATISNLTAGIYTLTIQNANGCTKTATFNLIQPSQINSSITSSINCFGGSLTTSITTTGGVGSSYSYSLNGVALPSNSVTNITAGTYTLITKDANNCLKENIITINQPPSPVFNFNITQPSCPTSTNGALSVNVLNMASVANYTWANPISNNAAITNIPQGIYTVTVKDGLNCIAHKTVQLLPISNIQTTVLTLPENCSAADGSSTIQVTGATPPLAYQLNTLVPQGSNTFANLTTGFYQITVTDANTCSLVTTFSVSNSSLVQLSINSFTPVKCYDNCDGQILLNISNAINPVTYSLTGLPTYSTNLISNVCAGTYTIKATDNIGCPATTTIQFNSPAPYSYSVLGNTQICVGKTAGLTSSVSGGTAPYTYSWSPGNLSTPSVVVNPTTTTVYNLNVFDANGCTLNPKTVTVNVNAPLTISVSPQNTGICPGTTAQITPSVSGGDGIYSYLWFPGNFTSASIFLSNLTTPTFTFVVSDLCGSPTASQVIQLQIFPKTIPTFSADVTEDCQPVCTKFVNTTLNTSQQIWNFGDKPFEQNAQNPSYCYYQNGKYNVKLSVIDEYGCKASSTYSNFIHVLPQPKPNFFTKPQILTDNLGEGELINSSTNANNFEWQIEDKHYTNNTNMTLFFNDTVCNIIKLIAKNQYGCVDSLQRKICVKPGFSFYMPNCFSPDNDGLNDILIPHGISWLSENYSFRLYNRWGQLIYKTETISEGWDGKIKGTIAPNDTYFYIIQVKDFYEKEHEFKGHILLLR